VRCTRKLLAVIRPARLADSPPDGEDWYANLLWFSGRKCLPLTHAATPFTVFEPDVRAAGLRDAGRLVTGLIRRELTREHLPQDTSGRLDPGRLDPGRLDPGQVTLAKTADRSVLGCMNDMVFMCEVAVDRSGGGADEVRDAPAQALHRRPFLTCEDTPLDATSAAGGP
jgi:hypothetical protein